MNICNRRTSYKARHHNSSKKSRHPTWERYLPWHGPGCSAPFSPSSRIPSSKSNYYLEFSAYYSLGFSSLNNWITYH